MATRITNASLKYKDLISKSTLIQQGSPAVYQLKPKREYIGSLTKMTISGNNVTKLNKTILLVGETGSGKSTLINALVNYAIGVRWKDDIWFQIVEEETESQSESQTSDVIVYQVFGFEGQTLPFSLTIIDTPGYGDTRGIELDVIVSERLVDLFRSEDGVHEINAVGLVMKASDNRLSDRLSYIFDSTMSLFSKNIEKNIIALITHSDGRTPKRALKALEAAKIKCARDAKNQPVHFLFNNCQTDDRTEDQELLEFSHKMTMRQMSRFKEFLETAEPQTMKTTVTVLNERVRLAAHIRNLQERIDFIELKQRKIKQTQEALKKHEQDMIHEKSMRYTQNEEDDFLTRCPKEHLGHALLHLTVDTNKKSAWITNASSKYKDLISKSILIQQGSPAVYQLRPKRENIGSLTKMTIGEKNVTKLNKTILLVGETGAGKSTLINALVNYAIGVTWEDDIWFQIVEEEKKSQSESQTSDVIMYQIFGFEGQTLPFSLTIIDTPGYGDTRGIEKDAIISERLLDLFRSQGGVHEINAVGLVMKASDNRLTDRLSYVFDSTMSLFSKNIEKNIVALITHSDGRTPENVLKALEDANIKCARDAKNQPVHFLFNNCQTDQRTNQNKVPLKFAWDFTADQMSQFTEFMKTAEPRSLVTTVDVLTKRVRLAACIQNLQERIEFIELKQREIQQTQEALKKHEQAMKNDENFTVEVDVSYKEKEKIDGGSWGLVFFEGAVTCDICEENCHYPGCTIAWYAEHCEVMKGGRCTSCTGKCPVTDHVKEKWIYVTKTRKVKKTLDDIKARYEKSKTESEKKLNVLENLQRKMEELQRDRDRWLNEAFLHVVTLEKITLNVNSVSTYVHLDFLIEKMKERGDTEKVQKLEKMKRRVDENKGSRAIVQYVFGKLSAAWQSS